MCRAGSDNAENLGVVSAALEAVAKGATPAQAYHRLCFALSGCRVLFPSQHKPLLREMIARMLAENMTVNQIIEKVGCSRQYVYAVVKQNGCIS
jgi:hypothetical protein